MTASASSPKASIPNACSICGGLPVRIITAVRAFCEVHQIEWLREELESATEAQIVRVAEALATVLDTAIDYDWNAHVRKLALAAIGAM